MDLYLVKTESGLKPHGDMDQIQYDKIRLGETRKFKCTLPRDILKHRKFFALLIFTLDNMPEHLEDHYPNSDKLREAIAIQIGHSEVFYSLDGTPHIKAKSISFAKMDQTVFDDFYQKAVDAILKYILKGVDEYTLEEMISFI